MLIYHGWIIVLPHWLESEEINYDMLSIIEQLKEKSFDVRGVKTRFDKTEISDNLRIYIDNLNGDWTILIGGSANRKREDFFNVVAFLQFVGNVAPGSYGLLHYMDDAEIENGKYDTYQRYVLKKGIVELAIEDVFSPFSSKVAE